MTWQRLLEVIRRELDLEELNLEMSSRADDVPGWDSLRHATILAAVESEFQVEFDTIEVVRLQTVGDLHALVERKLGARSE